MTDLAEILHDTERQLAAAGLDSARADSRILVSHATGIGRAQLIGRPDGLLEPDQIARIAQLTTRRAAHEPVALITGEREFWSLAFHVSPATLIPRPDSETLIEAALEHRPDRMRADRVLDLGTGSGCLLLSLLSELPNATGIGIDMNPDALAVASANAQRLGLGARSSFHLDDWGASLGERFDIILANPPYIATAEWAALDDDVRLFEPRTALLAGDDGLDAYRALAPQVRRLLMPGGLFIGEIGAGQAMDVAKVLRAVGLNVLDTRRDLAGIERCLLATIVENE
jgi:release factor glutamine methyltransferase